MPFPIPDVPVLTEAESRRIAGELDKITALAHAGVRGTSPGSVTRYALTRVGTRARKSLRQRTPQRTGELRKAIQGKVHSSRTKQLWYRAGFNRRKVARWQKVIAIEWGTSRMAPRRLITKVLTETVGRDGRVLKEEFVREMEKRIADLAAKANAQARQR